ncbi:MAG TPA: ATP synthase subunit I [Acidiferrobacterales bacterium]|nr:ATP synthase subunit I [Acidiferrobacterales bacterium]
MGYVDTLSRDTRRVLLTQALLTLPIAGGFGLARGPSEALAALYGGAITILITGWLARRVRQAGQARSPGAGLAVIYSSAVLRYAAVIMLVGMGIGLLKLAPLPLLSAFAVTQFGFLASWQSPRGVAGPGR